MVRASTTFQTIQELKRKRRYADALRELDAAIAAAPGDLFLRASRADVLVRMKHLPRARQAVDEVLAEDPEHQPGLTALGEVHLASGRLDLALEAFRAAAWDCRRGTSRMTPYLARRQAHVLGRMDDSDGALAVLEQALAVHPDDRPLRLDLARLLARRGSLQEARELAEQLVAGMPADPAARQLLLELRTCERPAEDVVRELSGALATGAGRSSADLWRLKAKREGEAKDWAGSAESWLQVHRLDPGNTYALRMAGFAFRKAGQPDRTVECLEPLFLDDPSDPYVRSSLLAALRQVHGSERVLATIDRALERHPDLVFLNGLRRKEEKRGASTP